MLSPDTVESLRQALESRATLDAARRAALAGREAPSTVPQISDIQVARDYVGTLPTVNPVANLFGGDIFESVFTFLSLGEVIGAGTKHDLEGDEIRRLMAGGAEPADLAEELAV